MSDGDELGLEIMKVLENVLKGQRDILDALLGLTKGQKALLQGEVKLLNMMLLLVIINFASPEYMAEVKDMVKDELVNILKERKEKSITNQAYKILKDAGLIE